MTETVQVPVDLLNSLKASIVRRTNDGWLQESYVTGTSVDKLIALIPEPIKVGDRINGTQFAALPPLSVAIDSDGDVWVRTAPGDATLVQAGGPFDQEYTTEPDAYLATDLGSSTVVHIGEEVN